MSKAATALLFDDHERGHAADSLWRGLGWVLLIFLATRMVAWVGAYVGRSYEFAIIHDVTPPMEQHKPRLDNAYADPESPEARDLRRMLMDFAPLCRFDGEHYRSIIEGGYRYVPVTAATPQKEREQNIAFFPLFPLIARPIGALVGSTRGGMVLVAHLAALLASLLLYRWIRWRIDEPVALFTVAVVLCLPQACYFSFGYAESLTFLFTVLVLWALDAGRPWLAATASGIATATRPTAAAIALTCGLTYWIRTRDLATRQRLLRLAGLLALAGAGLALYALFLTIEYGTPLVYTDNFRAGWVPDRHRASWFEYLTLARVWDQFKHFGRAFAVPPMTFVELLNPFTWNMPTNLLVMFLSLAGLPRVPKSFRPFLALGPLIFAQAYLASGGATFGVQPMSRYVMLAVSAWVVLAVWAVREWPTGLRYGMLTFFVLLQFGWALRFGFGEWSS